MAFVRNNNNNNNNGRRHNNNYNNNRHRNPNNGGGQSQNSNGPRRHVNRVNQVFESNGPEGRVRGTAAQIVEKYTTMGRDAGMSGDRVLSMNYLQHAEHYQRLLNEITEENAGFEKEREATRQQQQAQPEISADAAAEGFVPSEQPNGEARPQEQRPERAERPERPERQDRPERGERPQRPERGPRPEMRPETRPERRRPVDDAGDDNQLPGFLQVPIKAGKNDDISSFTASEAEPAAAAAPKARRAPALPPEVEKIRPTRIARPRRPVQEDDVPSKNEPSDE